MTRISDPEIVGTPPNLWPPALELPNGKWLGQTGVIVNYLSPKLGLAGYAMDDPDLDEDEKAFLNAKNTQLVLTVMDMMVEVSVGYPGTPFVSYSWSLVCRSITSTTQCPSTSTMKIRKRRHCVPRNNSEPPAFQNSSNTSNLFSKPTPQTRMAKVMGFNLLK